ncbi:hypothetical protein KIW84_013231 [Lathyrus oleraceus]|uniref:Gag-pol polyprotein n=1 Tax=Pisum sativum TaxID=3888 RepID=A0A9D5GXT8_PEA|nr:hypothetical protein KIW84_013231 [Pisum sativum]
MPSLRQTPEIRSKGIITEPLEKWDVKLSSAQAYMAKIRALELIQSAETEQYAYLRNHVEGMRRFNPNTIMIVKCGMSDIGPVFERIYVCLETCKVAFAHTCKPLIGIDTCFLKGEDKRHLEMVSRSNVSGNQASRQLICTLSCHLMAQDPGLLQMGKINPPVMRRAPGRPNKQINKANDETTSRNVLIRNLTTIKYKNCGILGHNSRTCKGKTAMDRQLVKGSNKVTKAKKQRKSSTKEADTVLTQGSQAP